MAILCKYVLAEEIGIYETVGWKLSSKKIALKLGGWATVIMEKEEV